MNADATNLPRFETHNDGKVSIVCWGSRSPAAASRVDIMQINGVGRATLTAIPNATGRHWIYPEAGGGYSSVTPIMAALIERHLPGVGRF